MKIKTSLTALAMFCVLFSFPSDAQPAAAAPPPVTATMLDNGLYLMSGGGGANSTVLIADSGILVVDSKLNPESATEELALIAELSDSDVRYLINTHVHPDHTGGNIVYGERGAIIIGQAETRSILAAGQRGGPPEPAAALPVITLGNEPLTLHVGDETVIIMPMPAAHTTDNSIVHYVNANVYHLGDIFSTSRYPVVAGGTLQGFIDGASQLLDTASSDARFIPGNGDVATIEDLQQFRAMLVTVQERIVALVEDGKTLEELVSAAPTAEFDAQWGSPDRFITAAYNELSNAN